MASRVGAYQCWLRLYASLSPRGSSASCHSIRDSQRSVLSDGTASFCYTVQDINSSILRRSGTGDSGKQQMRQTREHAV